MPKFIRKPTVVESIQWKVGRYHIGVDYEAGRPYVTTIHGQRAYLNEGDWIMPEPDGLHFYPCKDEVFRATYEPVNSYDKGDTVRQRNMLRAGPLKIAEYTVRDPETGEHGPRQFHMTFDNCVIAVMSETMATTFCNFVDDAMNPERRQKHMDLVPICREFIDERHLTSESDIPLWGHGLNEFVAKIAYCIGYAKVAEAA